MTAIDDGNGVKYSAVRKLFVEEGINYGDQVEFALFMKFIIPFDQEKFLSELTHNAIEI